MGKITIGQHHYDIGRLDTFTQLDIARRWSPVLMQLGLLQKPEKGKPQPRPDAIYKAMLLFARGISQEDQDYVQRACLSCIKRQTGTDQPWSPVQEPMSGRLMFEDMDITTVLKLMWHVLDEHKLPDFFVEPPSTTGDRPGA